MILDHSRMGDGPHMNLPLDDDFNQYRPPAAMQELPPQPSDRAVSEELSSKSEDGTAVKRGRKSRPKVKTGCTNCKQRRIKCDELRPSCTQCLRGKKICTGYPPPPRSMRPEAEIRIAPKPLLSRMASAPALAAAAASSSSTSIAPSHTPLSPASSIGDRGRRVSVISKEVVLPPRRASRRTRRRPCSTSPVPQLPDITTSPLLPPSQQLSFQRDLPELTPDATYFRIFQNQTASELSGFFDSVFYKERVLETCHTEPAIRHAAIALGALYKTLEPPPHLTCGDGHTVADNFELTTPWQVAFRQYSEACQAMMSLGAPSQNSLRTRLMASVLLASFDSFIGDYKQAIAQIQNGLDLLERIRAEQRLPAYGVSAGVVEEELTIIFMRLAIQAKSYDLAFHFPEPYVVKFTSPAIHESQIQELGEENIQPFHDHHHDDPNRRSSLTTTTTTTTDNIHPSSPSSTSTSSRPLSPALPYRNLREARLAHDRLNERMVRFQESLHIRPVQAFHIAMPRSWERALASFKSQLTSWAKSFEPILEARHAVTVGRRERAGIAALQMAHLNAIVISAIQFVNTESAFDNYMVVLQKIVDMGLEIVKEEEQQGIEACKAASPYCQHKSAIPPEYVEAGIFSAVHIRPTFSMDLGIIAPLWVVATKCRQPLLRRQAIELLRSCGRREGMWDSDLTARIAHWVMTLEEELPEATASHLDRADFRPIDESFNGLSREEQVRLYFRSQPSMVVPDERRVAVKAVDFDLRARFASVTVGTRGLPDGVADANYRVQQMTW